MKKLICVFILLTCFSNILSAEEKKLTLEECLQIAYKQNKLFQAAKIDVELANLNIDKAIAVCLPEINAKANYTHNGLLAQTEFQGTFVTIGQEENYLNQVSLNQPLFNRRTFVLLKQAKINIDSKENNLSEEKNMLTLKVKEDFYNLLRSGKMVELQENALELMKDHLKNAQALFKNGMVIETDVLQAEMESVKAEKNLLIARQNKILAQKNFNLTLGLNIDDPVKIEEDTRSVNFDLADLDFYQKETLNSRPSLKKIKDDLLIAQEYVTLARSGFWPKVSANANYSWTDATFMPKNDSWAVGITFDINLFNGGFTRAEIKEASYNLEQTRQRLWQLQQSITLEAEKSFMKIKEIQELVNVNKKILNIASENFNLNQKRYQKGLVSNTDVLEAYTALFEAKTNKISADYDYIIAIAKLEKTVGIPLISK
ncbi:MAG: TolC family protein [bacterium]|nr:TolC family protein [bacterium]